MRNLKFVALMTGISLAAACGSDPVGPGDGPSSDVVAVDSIQLLPATIQLATVGDSRRLTVWFHPIDATDKDVTWSSSNPAVASVDDQGLVTAIAQGAEVIITATAHDGGTQATTRVRLGAPPAVVEGSSLK